MKLDNQYICIQENYPGSPWVRIDTFSYYMRDSKKKLLGESITTWKEARKIGWRCVKVQINLTFI